MLRKYKQRPCALERDRMPPMSPEQKLLVDFVLSCPPDSMTDMERLRFASITAAYVGVSYSEVRVVSVAPANSSRVRVELPQSGAEALVAGFQARDPRLFAFFAEVGGEEGVLRIEAAKTDEASVKTDTTEKGLETLIFNGMTSFGWLPGNPKDYERDYAVDLLQLSAFLGLHKKPSPCSWNSEAIPPSVASFLRASRRR